MKVFVVLNIHYCYDTGMIVDTVTEIADVFNNKESAEDLEDYLNTKWKTKGKNKGYSYIEEFDLETKFDPNNYE